MSGRHRATGPEVRRGLRLREQGWKLIDIAVVLGVSESTVSRWCRGLTRHQETGGPGSSSQPAGRGDGPAYGHLDARPATARRVRWGASV